MTMPRWIPAAHPMGRLGNTTRCGIGPFKQAMLRNTASIRAVPGPLHV
jgi:hypothetical protein